MCFIRLLFWNIAQQCSFYNLITFGTILYSSTYLSIDFSIRINSTLPTCLTTTTTTTTTTTKQSEFI
jgi:hypothetical protein